MTASPDTPVTRFPRSPLRLFAFALLGVVLLAALLIGAATWRFFGPDEPLSPAAQAALTWSPPTENELEGNAALVVLGFNAPFPSSPAADPVAPAVALGRQRLAFDIAAFEWARDHGDAVPNGTRRPTLAQAVPGAQTSLADAQAIVPDALRCPSGNHALSPPPPQPEADCLPHILDHRAQWQALIAQGGGWLVRLAAIAQAPRYAEVQPMLATTASPPFHHLSRAHDLALAQAALTLADGQSAAALRQFDVATQTLERIAAQGGSLIGSVVMAAQMQRSLHWASSALRHYPELARQPELASQLQTTLARLHTPMQQALAAEMRMFARTLHHLRHSQQQLEEKAGPTPTLTQRTLLTTFLAFSRASYQPQRTVNATVQRFEHLAAAAQAPAHQTESAWAQAQTRIAADDRARLGWLRVLHPHAPVHLLRNPVGEKLLDIGMPDFAPYMLRSHDLEGHRRLVLLQLAALRESVPATHMPAWLAASPAALHDPYTQAPMQWDADSNSLSFTGRSAQKSTPPAPPPVFRVRYGN